MEGKHSGSNFTIKIVAVTVKHKRVVSVRRYVGCRETAPRTRVYHRRPSAAKH